MSDDWRKVREAWQPIGNEFERFLAFPIRLLNFILHWINCGLRKLNGR